VSCFEWRAYRVPAVDAAALDDVRDQVLVHFLELLRAAGVELAALHLELLQLR